MNNIKKFAEFVNESLNEAELPSWVGNGPYESLKDMFGIIGDDIQNADGSELTAADVNNNYKPALKYLGVRSIDDMGMIANSIDDDGMYDGADAIDKQMKSSNFLGNDGGKGMNTNPYTAAYKGKVGDIKVIIVQDINGENSYVYAATKGGKLKESLNESTELNEAILGPTYLQDVRELIMDFGDEFEPSEIIKGAKSMEKELMKTVKLAIKDLVDYKKDELEESLNEKFTFADAVETAGDDVKKNEKGIAAALKALKARKADDIMIMTDTTEDDGLFDAIKGMKTLPIDSTIYDKAYVGKYKGKDVVIFDGGGDLFAYTK